MNRLEKLKEKLCDKHLDCFDPAPPTAGLSFNQGWNAASAEYEKIIAELQNALESAESAIAVFTVTAYGKYNPNDWSLLEVKKALQKLKEFRGEE